MMKHYLPFFFFLLLFSLSSKQVTAKNDLPPEVQPLAGTDELGRILPDYKDVGNPKKDKQVGMFYFLWQGDNASKTSEYYWDLSKIIPQHPEVLEDAKNKYWGTIGFGGYYFWGEPIYGYYNGEDYWVHLRNMQLLADAGIDFLILDTTNAIIYEKQSESLMKAISALQAQGKKVPLIVFYTNTASGETMQRIYNAFYKPEAPHYHPSTWYIMEGKPLIIGRTKEAKERDYQSFFTFREAQWPNEAAQANGWPWIDFTRPQMVYSNLKGEREIINVSVAQHPNPEAGMGGSAFYGNKDNWGRSYRNSSMGNPETDIRYGYNFQEQWDYAIEQDVPFVFVTGWNEWIAGRWSQVGKDAKSNRAYFVDQADPEYSRDIEPTLTAGLKDTYYMQLIANVRKYKGMSAYPKAKQSKGIKRLKDWSSVNSVYWDYTDDTEDRNHLGAELKPTFVYVNESGRNDFHILKAAHDKKDLYFYAKTTNPITPNSGSNWMRLYINTDRNNETGWNGYDYRIDEGKYLQRYSDGVWSTISTITVIQEEAEIMYRIPLKPISLKASELNLEFKWSDNMQDDDPMDWYVNGDVAPGGRLNFVYQAE